MAQVDVPPADPAEVAASDERLTELLSHVADVGGAPSLVEQVAEASRPHAAVVSSGAATIDLPRTVMATAIPESLSGARLTVRCRGLEAPMVVDLAPGVSREVVAAAVRNGDRVVLEQGEGEAVAVVGVLHTRVPEELVIHANKVRIEADEEFLVRSGAGAMRVRRDGDVEIVGSRISVMSRGLFRLVGRMLRLN